MLEGREVVHKFEKVHNIKELVYLGFKISKEGLNMEFQKVEAILHWP